MSFDYDSSSPFLTLNMKIISYFLYIQIIIMYFLLVFNFCDFCSCDVFFRDYISVTFFPVTYFRPPLVSYLAVQRQFCCGLSIIKHCLLIMFTSLFCSPTLALIDIHYENLPMQYTEIFRAIKIETFYLKIFHTFLFFLLKT